MTFAVPWLSYLAAATPLCLAVVFAIDFTRRRRALDAIADSEALRQMLVLLSVRRRVLKAILTIVGVTLVVAALARPQIEGESTWQQRGIDVAVVIDYSKSMLAEDVYPNRLRRAQLELDTLMDELQADRVAVVAAAGQSDAFPLTHDPDAIRSFLAVLSPRAMAPGSDLGAGVARARCMLLPLASRPEDCADRPADGEEETPVVLEDDRARAIVLFTDGGDTGGRLGDEVERAAAAGIRVFLVGVGTAPGELIPVIDEDGRRAGWQMDGEAYITTRLDRDALEAARLRAGELGELAILDDKSFRVQDLVAKLQTLKKGDLDRRVVRKPIEVYHWFLFPALMLLVIEACIRERRRRPA